MGYEKQYSFHNIREASKLVNRQFNNGEISIIEYKDKKVYYFDKDGFHWVNSTFDKEILKYQKC